VPRYEYRCRDCEHTFELTRSMSESAAPATCPYGHTDTVKLLSTIAVTGRSGPTATRAPAPMPSGGGCCGGGCGCGRCGRLHAEKGAGSGLGTGGNSDSGGPGDAVRDGGISHASAGAGGTPSASWPSGANGCRAETRKPHPSQYWPVEAVPQRGHVSPLPGTNRPGA
jgi:putative FmdB family regulatory protein